MLEKKLTVPKEVKAEITYLVTQEHNNLGQQHVLQYCTPPSSSTQRLLKARTYLEHYSKVFDHVEMEEDSPNICWVCSGHSEPSNVRQVTGEDGVNYDKKIQNDG